MSGDTLMTGVALLIAWRNDVLAIGWKSGAPKYFTVRCAAVREIVAVCGIWLAINASLACGVPGMDTRTLAFGLCSGIFEKSDGRLPPGTYVHGPPCRDGDANQRPAIST